MYPSLQFVGWIFYIGNNDLNELPHFCNMIEKIKEMAAAYAAEFIDVRRHLHAHPELSYQEYETSKYVQ